MTDNTIYDEASEVEADGGVVSVKGPDHVAVKLTPNAAAETSDRLLKGSMRAQGQRIREKRDQP